MQDHGRIEEDVYFFCCCDFRTLDSQTLTISLLFNLLFNFPSICIINVETLHHSSTKDVY